MKSIEKRKILVSSAYFLSFLVLGATEAAIGPSLPSLAKLAGTTLSGISMLFVAQKAGYLLGSLIGGRLYDRLKVHWLLGAVILLMGTGMFFVPLATMLPALLLVIFIVGFSEGALDVGGNVLLVWLNPPKMGSMMNALHVFFGIGAFIAPLILAVSLRYSGNITTGFWIIGAAAVPAAVLIVLLPGPSPMVHEKKEAKDSARPLLIVLISLFFFLFVGAEAAFGAWIYTYAVSKNIADVVTAGILTSAYWGAFTVGRVAAIFAALRLRPQTLIGLSLAATILGLLLLTILPDSSAALWFFTIFIGFSVGPIFASTMTLAGENLRMTGGVTGFFLIGTSVGGMILPWGIGQFFEARGAGIMPLSILINTAAAFGLFIVILLVVGKRKRNGIKD